MNEFLIILFIVTGFLLGTVLFGNLFHFLLNTLPEFSSGTREDLKSSISILLNLIQPLMLWTLASGAAFIIVNYFFSSYMHLFISGAIISIVFIFIDMIKNNYS